MKVEWFKEESTYVVLWFYVVTLIFNIYEYWIGYLTLYGIISYSVAIILYEALCCYLITYYTTSRGKRAFILFWVVLWILSLMIMPIFPQFQ